jgi:hypothetical protein
MSHQGWFLFGEFKDYLSGFLSGQVSFRTFEELNVEEMLIHTHSGLRWIALILLVYAVMNAMFHKNSGEFSKKDKMVNLFAMVTLHIQLIVGLVLYFRPSTAKVQFIEGWMKDDQLRFYGMEHLAGMLAAIILVTIGYSKAKRCEAAYQKHKKTFTYYLLGLILILSFIPWPFREALGGNWF